VTFHGAYADDAGFVLVGERPTPSGPVGVVTEIALSGSLSKAAVVDVRGAGPLRAVTRLGQSILACGDGGVLALVPERAAPRFVRLCEVPLLAVVATGDESAAVVGRGGFAFRVTRGLDYRLEAVQTTRDLYAVTCASDGVAWAGGEKQRVLYRGPQGWTRVPTGGESGDVRSMWADRERVRAFTDDGAVLEGRR
jgi:hypothetical protein